MSSRRSRRFGGPGRAFAGLVMLSMAPCMHMRQPWPASPWLRIGRSPGATYLHDAKVAETRIEHLAGDAAMGYKRISCSSGCLGLPGKCIRVQLRGGGACLSLPHQPESDGKMTDMAWPMLHGTSLQREVRPPERAVAREEQEGKGESAEEEENGEHRKFALADFLPTAEVGDESDAKGKGLNSKERERIGTTWKRKEMRVAEDGGLEAWEEGAVAAEDALGRDCGGGAAVDLTKVMQNAAGMSSIRARESRTQRSTWRGQGHRDQHGLRSSVARLGRAKAEAASLTGMNVSAPSQVLTMPHSKLGRLEDAGAAMVRETRAEMRGERRRDKADRATLQQVLDPRTIRILDKLRKNGLLTDIYGCVSTGKEANVYHAFSNATLDMAVSAGFGPKRAAPDPLMGSGVVDQVGEVAIKVFKTSILVFKDRDKYISGDYRFRRGYSKNPRKMVRMWAEKEFRNLHRLHTAGVRCPRPILLKSHVLVMEFIGVNGTAASKLKHAVLDAHGWVEAYEESVVVLRQLLHSCNLIHGDLSEYNLMHHEGRVIVIDVSQSISPDHPEAFAFLQADIRNLASFFRSKGVPTLPIKATFHLVVAPDLTAMQMLDRLRQLMASRNTSDWADDAEERAQDAIFLGGFMPQNLREVEVEEQVMNIREGGGVESLEAYSMRTGMNITTALRAAAAAAGSPESDRLSKVDSMSPSTHASKAGLKASDILRSLGFDPRGRPLAATPESSRLQKQTAALGAGISAASTSEEHNGERDQEHNGERDQEHTGERDQEHTGERDQEHNGERDQEHNEAPPLRHSGGLDVSKTETVSDRLIPRASETMVENAHEDDEQEMSSSPRSGCGSLTNVERDVSLLGDTSDEPLGEGQLRQSVFEPNMDTSKGWGSWAGPTDRRAFGAEGGVGGGDNQGDGYSGQELGGGKEANIDEDVVDYDDDVDDADGGMGSDGSEGNNGQGTEVLCSSLESSEETLKPMEECQERQFSTFMETHLEEDAVQNLTRAQRRAFRLGDPKGKQTTEERKERKSQVKQQRRKRRVEKAIRKSGGR